MALIEFKNLPDETTPIDAGNLNLLQDNVDNAKLEKSDVVNNLTTTSATKALSANQGKILNDKNNYSTTEVAIGMWKENVLYRKIVSGTTSSASGWQPLFDFSYSAYGVVSLRGFLHTGSATYPLPSNEPNYNISIIHNGISNKIEMLQQSTAFYNKPYTIIIEYIKL